MATAIRTTVVLALAWGVVAFGNHLNEIRDVGSKTWCFLVLSGLATGASWLFYFKAMQMGDVCKVASVDKLSIVITILLAFVFLREEASIKVVLGALLITAGSILMLYK